MHQLFSGPAANWSALGKDCCIRAMVARSYNALLLPDATTGVEFPDTLPILFATEMGICEAEPHNGFGASNEDFGM